MKWVVSFLLLLGSSFYAHAQVRNITELTSGWKFCKGPMEEAMLKSFDDSHWQSVTLPHDWAIEGPWIVDGDANTGKLPWKGEGWYRTWLDIPEQDAGKRIYLLCDGIMAFPEIFINGNLTGKWDYGYTSFRVDISDYVSPGEQNLLVIHADTRLHDSRWYPGAGIYRKIRLITVNPLHVGIWGTYVTTPVIGTHHAEIHIATTIENALPEDAPIQVRYFVYHPDGSLAGEKKVSAHVSAQDRVVLENGISLPNPRLWDIEDPALYTLVTEIYRGDNLTDSVQLPFGIRTIAFTADTGFYLNHRRVQFKGVNLHHDLGPLGAAFNERAMERQLEIMKQMGCNAIRTSHNPPAPELLDLCDKMGLLVFDELFDKYDAKADITDTTNFEDFARRNIRNFMLRDRNHPSIFIWSVGNEIGDVQWNKNDGFRKLETMVNEMRKYDTTRPVTLVCDSYESAKLRHFDYYDVHCWNYGRRYTLARQLEPTKAVIISESASTLSTRGFYEFPLPAEKTDFTSSLQVSSYDLNAPEWAELADDDFKWQQQEPYVAGEFVWTGFDYLGEPTPYNNAWTRERKWSDSLSSRSSYFGVVDLCGIPKDRYYLYKSYWKPEDTTIHILPHWNWEERIGDTVPVFVYTNGDCAELFVNGKSQGKRCKDPASGNSTERFRLMWKDVIYEPGTVKAVAYKNGREIGTKEIKTAGKPDRLKLTPDRKIIRADGRDLSFILVEAVDQEGNLSPFASDLLNIRLSGPGTIAGIGNGNPQSYHPFQSDSVNLFFGKAMIIIRGDNTPGKIDVAVTATGLDPAETVVHLTL